MLSEKIIRGIIAVVVIVSVTAACTSALYIPDAINTPYTASMLDLQAGRKLYIGKCGSCHSLYLPEKYNPEKWTILVDSMTKKADVNPEEKKLIIGYLTKGLK